MSFQKIFAKYRTICSAGCTRSMTRTAIFLLALCLCWSCSLPVCRDTVPESSGLVSRVFSELFEDADQETRMEAYFLSVGLPDMPELERILRQQRENGSDPLERIVVSYALAAMTRNQQDIDVFLDDFPNEPQLFVDLMKAEWAVSGTFNTGMADFLLLLAYEPQTREKALPHLARIARNMPGELESMGRYFEDPLARPYIDDHLDDAALDLTLYNADNGHNFVRKGRCGEKIGYLIQNGDPASKTTALLMMRRMWIPENLIEIRRKFYELLHELPTDPAYRYLLRFDSDVAFFSNFSAKDIVCLLQAEKKLYCPPLRGIVGELWGSLPSDDKKSARILKILGEIRKYGKDLLEICEVNRLSQLQSRR